MLLTSLLPTVCSASFLIYPRTTWSGVALSTVGQALAYQSSTKKVLYIFSFEVPIPRKLKLVSSWQKQNKTPKTNKQKTRQNYLLSPKPFGQESLINFLQVHTLYLL